MKNQRKHLLFLTLLLSIMVTISSVLPLYATGEEIPTTEEPTTEVTPTETPLMEESGENTPLPTDETTPTTVEEVPPTESAQPTPTEETLPTEEPVVEVKQLDLSEHLVGLEEETYHTSIQFGNEETGLIQYEKDLDKYSVTGFNADEINVSLNLHWNISEEVNIDEYDSAIYHLPENIAWDGDTITVYDLEDQPLELNEVATLEENTLTLKSFEVKHISINGTIAALELEEPETVVEEKVEEVPTEETENLEEEPKEIVEEEKVIEKVTDIFTFSGIGQVDVERSKEHTIRMMKTLGAPRLGNPPLTAPGGCAVNPEPIETINISEHLVAKSDPNSAGVYAWIKLNGKTFALNDHLHDDPQFKEEVDKLPESLPDSTKNVEVYLSWRVDPKPIDGTLTKDTKFVYTLPDGIHWDPEEVEIVDLKNPDGKPAGTFKVNGREIEATYSADFIKRVNASCSSFTSHGTIEGSATLSDWDDIGNEPYHFEGIGYFEPQLEEAIARIRTTKNLIKDTVSYLGNGKFRIQYRTDITGSYKREGTPGRVTNVKVNDTFDNSMSLPDNPGYTLTSNKTSSMDDRPANCTVNPGGKGFNCTIPYIDDGETLTLTYFLDVDLNYTDEDPAPSPLASATRNFENDVEVTADNPSDPTSPLKDTSFVIDTYSMSNPKKEGKPYSEAPEQAEWEIHYNVGKFSKASSGEFPGINIGGMYISDTMGEGQKLVPNTFKIETSTDGENWTKLSGVTPTWEDKDQDGIEEFFSLTLPNDVYDFVRISYRSESTKQHTTVMLTNTASIASDDEGTDERTGDGEAPLIGPSNLPKIKKTGDEYGPDGNFEWTSEITIYEDMNRNVRVYDAMEQGLILYPNTIKVERIKKIDGEEQTEEVTGWLFNGDTAGQNTYNRNPKPGDDLSGNPPWMKDKVEDSSYTWWIELTDENTLLDVDGYEFTTNPATGELETTDNFAKYRITYQTNAPLPELDEEGNPKAKKYLNEAQVRAKKEDTNDNDDRYNTSQAELEKKYIEKESNDSVYETVTGNTVDTKHGYIGWFIRVYPLDTNGFVEITDAFSYSTQDTSMTLDKNSVHVYVSTNKQRPTSDEEISPSLYTISNSNTNGFTLRINNAPSAGITKSKYIYVFYQTRVDPRVNNRTIRYTNTANLNRNGDKMYPPATASRSRNDIVVSKTSKRNGPYVTYTLAINQELFNIDPENGTLTIEDTRGASIEYIEGSMHFYDGDQYKASDAPETKETYKLKGSPYAVTSNGHTITITIPDEKYIVIEYRAYITKKDGDLSGEDGLNIAVIKGQRGFSVSNQLRGKVQKARAGTSIDTDHPWIKIMKADSKTLKELVGAKFKFTAFNVDLATGELTPMDGEVYEIETDENGTIWFTFDHEKEWMTYYDVVYEVKEVTAPKGYDLDTTVHYILFTDHPENYEGIDKYTINGKQIEVLIEPTQFLHRIDYPNNLTPPPTPTPKKPGTYVPVPNTGDNFHVGMWIALLGGTVVIILFLLFYLRKNNKKD